VREEFRHVMKCSECGWFGDDKDAKTYIFQFRSFPICPNCGAKKNSLRPNANCMTMWAMDKGLEERLKSSWIQGSLFEIDGKDYPQVGIGVSIIQNGNMILVIMKSITKMRSDVWLTKNKKFRTDYVYAFTLKFIYMKDFPEDLLKNGNISYNEAVDSIQKYGKRIHSSSHQYSKESVRELKFQELKGKFINNELVMG
jgi:hypothetical protein